MTHAHTHALLSSIALLIAAAPALASAQELAGGPNASGSAWQRFGEAQEQPAAAPQADPQPVARPETPPIEQETPVAPTQTEAPRYGLPDEVTIPAGTLISIRINEPLSSNRSQPGDSFTGVLAQPVVVDGVVVASRGQSVWGRVAEAVKARSNAPSRLGLELTGITLADGTQKRVRSQLAGRQGDTSAQGEQVATVAGTTALGAIIGAAAGRGSGAAVGAAAGVTAGAIAVLLTRNRPTVLYPETVLTFATDAPVLVSMVRAPHSFRFVGPEDYDRQAPAAQRRTLAPRCGNCFPPPVWGGPVMYPGWGPYWGTGVSVIFSGGHHRRYGRWR